MKHKLTLRFPGTTNPVHVGVYKVFYKFTLYDGSTTNKSGYSYWDGRRWMCVNFNEDASYYLVTNKFKWCGILK